MSKAISVISGRINSNPWRSNFRDQAFLLCKCPIPLRWFNRLYRKIIDSVVVQHYLLSLPIPRNFSELYTRDQQTIAHGPNLCFCRAHKLKIYFYIFKWLKNSKDNVCEIKNIWLSYSFQFCLLACKASDIYYLTLYRKYLPCLGLDYVGCPSVTWVMHMP